MGFLIKKMREIANSLQFVDFRLLLGDPYRLSRKVR